jgi:pimeloyl-ACP methyl ester carboxylesterase
VDAPWDYVRIEGGGHWLPLDEPQRVVELADDWFGRC